MAQYPISQEGVEKFHELAGALDSCNSEITGAGNTLREAVSGEGDLGEFEEQILDMVANVKQIQAQGEADIAVLSAKINALANNIESMLSL